ncbi:MAG: hypothetical protein H6966_10025 [Chromatiaceae bacterium]|nr:hypothetical protein [Chromatiaceae bacterium]
MGGKLRGNMGYTQITLIALHSNRQTHDQPLLWGHSARSTKSSTGTTRLRAGRPG